MHHESDEAGLREPSPDYMALYGYYASGMMSLQDVQMSSDASGSVEIGGSLLGESMATDAH